MSEPLPCGWCSTDTDKVYHRGHCPQVKAIEYYEDGTIKRVEFHAPQFATASPPGGYAPISSN